MSTDVYGLIECRPGARLWGPDDEDSVWQVAIDLTFLDVGNSYDALACLFGVRNTFGFRPLSEGRGVPADASDRLRNGYFRNGEYEGSGTTWISWAELASADWEETDLSGTRSRRSVAGADTHWGPVWTVMSTLSDLHGPEEVRLVVWFL